jgi:hypothetical protein
MVSGRLKCIGGAQHLRSRYGHGYQLDLNASLDKVAAVKSFVATNFIGSELIEVYERNLKFRIRKGDRSLGAIFRLINEQKASLGVTEYSVSEATLEQIFINFAKSQEEESISNEGAPQGFVDSTPPPPSAASLLSSRNNNNGHHDRDGNSPPLGILPPSRIEILDVQ